MPYMGNKRRIIRRVDKMLRKKIRVILVLSILCSSLLLGQGVVCAADQYVLFNANITDTKYDLSGLVCTETKTLVNEPQFMTSASYVEKELTSTEYATANSQIVVTIERKCKVWYYTDGKVHLYSRSITKSTTPAYSPTTITLGNIVNTDGSLSYTSGDKVKISNGTTSYTEALEFNVTPSGYSFTHYRE
jgi:uncharacterized membrane protein YciS (DUF1049 family)